MAIPATPTLDRLAAASARREAVTDFLDWCQREHLLLARYDDRQVLCPMFERADPLILRWLGVDAAAVERERRALLASIQG